MDSTGTGTTGTSTGTSTGATTGIGAICAAYVVAQIMVLTLMPPHARWIAFGLVTMVTVVLLIAAVMEVSFRRAAERAAKQAAEAGPDAPTAVHRPRPRPGDQASPLIQRAYYLARNGASPSHIAGICDIPEAFAALIIADARHTGSRKGRAARNASGPPRDDLRRPENPPAP